MALIPIPILVPTDFMQASMILTELLFWRVKNALSFMSGTGRAKKRRRCQVNLSVKDEQFAGPAPGPMLLSIQHLPPLPPIEIDWIVEVVPPLGTPPPQEVASLDIIWEALEPPEIPLLVKPEECVEPLAPISCRVAVVPPEGTPPPKDFASPDMIDEAREPLAIPEEVKPALWTFWSDILPAEGAERSS